MSAELDPRVNAMRADLADAALAGRVEAARFVPGAPRRIVAGHAPLRAAPSDDATMLSEALAGEAVQVFDTVGEWAWVQLAADRYVGWVPAETLAADAPAPTHRVAALSTFAFARPDIKAPPLAALPLGAQVAVTGEAHDRNADYALIAPAGAVVTQHLASLDAVESDWTSVAERFVGTPYLWGGKTVAGIDCSGLVQVALQACGLDAPRDSDMQEQALGDPVDWGAPLRRGDLVFWRGHVGLMIDAGTLLHANAHHMMVARESLQTASARFATRGLTPASIRRVAGR